MGALAAIVSAGLLLWVVRCWINTRLGREPTEDEVCREVVKVYERAGDEIHRKVQHPYRDQARTDEDQAQTEHDQARMELMARLGMDPTEYEVRARVQRYTVD